MADNAYGFQFGFTKKKWSDVELAHILVLDRNFSQKETMAILLFLL